MKMLKKSLGISTLVMGILFIAVTTILCSVRGDLFFIGYNKFFIAPSYSKTDKFLKTNIYELSYVASKLSKMDYDSITIKNESDGGEDEFKMRVKSEYQVYDILPVPHELTNHIKVLYESGVQDISCGRSSVNFTIWTTMDESRGIIYSSNGIKPEGEQFIDVIQLSKSNWYYYVHNYEKAKARNPDKFK